MGFMMMKFSLHLMKLYHSVIAVSAKLMVFNVMKPSIKLPLRLTFIIICQICRIRHSCQCSLQLAEALQGDAVTSTGARGDMGALVTTLAPRLKPFFFVYVCTWQYTTATGLQSIALVITKGVIDSLP